MLRKLMPQKVGNSELGYIVQSAGRECVEYVEPDRLIRVEVDRGISTGIYSNTVKFWETKAGKMLMTEGEINQVLKRVDEALVFMGCKTEII